MLYKYLKFAPGVPIGECAGRVPRGTGRPSLIETVIMRLNAMR